LDSKIRNGAVDLIVLIIGLKNNKWSSRFDRVDHWIPKTNAAFDLIVLIIGFQK